ncbi:helix-turn-helix domain-containing protein [Nostoc sp.]|uniref:helix-turn-helix domain-containing protein n=1 Tax=Nostoc sp. TaxID=1180 RepID=UPI002FF9B1F9
MLIFVNQTLIKWKLKEVMARYDIKAGDLANELNLSANSVSNLRKAKTMPRLDGHSLNNLCNALNRLAHDLDRQITPFDLIDYTPDSDTSAPSKNPNSSKSSALSQGRKSSAIDAENQACLTAA